MPRYPHNPPENEDDEVQAWVELPPAVVDLRLVADTGTDHDVDEHVLPEEFWFDLDRIRTTPDAADTAPVPRRGTGLADRLPRSAWAALAATVAVLAGVLLLPTGTSGDIGAQVPSTAAPPSSTTPVQGPCTGLTGEVVTESAGDPATLAGVIASFEAAYYIHRDAGKAMPLLAPESGITFEGLAAGIASVPPGTRHCVAITPIAPTAANVHIAEIRPDRTRTDYLQLINTRPADTGGALLISNVQKQG
ncbi:hypothetical protein NN3_24760 [Nocardia neocaledoniensis NBRC 108232]|uniref:DUF8176 domain-containing protein n=1 Tax=Nocardia neocaledoniensis TaxID=236511 RepID=A0A317NWB5_9NOCA|nr:hypothetical protein [Nocardia neocaledoniensis]PWV79686.1 hypothetical protein DFR69_102752 [Nocardia neocaledoniensis]GEM31469.1 hypothetical protein NN3_24760 [Nocardia neocaledoniensis NBRC 108232]